MVIFENFSIYVFSYKNNNVETMLKKFPQHIDKITKF